MEPSSHIGSVENQDTAPFTIDSVSSKLSVLKRPKRTGRWYQMVRVDDYYVRFKLDTGADVTTLPVKYVKSMKGIEIKPYVGPSMKTYSGQRMVIVGTIEVVIMCNNEIVVDEVFIADLDEEPLLGRDLCYALKLIERVEVCEVQVKESEMEQFL